MRWRSAILLIVPAIGLLAWLVFAPPSDSKLPNSTSGAVAAEQPLADPAAQRQAYIHRAAKMIVELEETQPDMGGAGLKKRYEELLRDEEPLHLEYEAIKAERAIRKSK